MSSDTPAVTPTPPPAKTIPWSWIIAVALAYFFGAGKNPLDLIAPPQEPQNPPVVIEPQPVDPQPVPPVDPPPREPIVPDQPPVDEPEPEPEPQPPPKQLDETAAITRYAAELLPQHVHKDVPKMAEVAASCADRIDAGSIQSEKEANVWLTIENYHAASDYDAWRPFFRGMQSRFNDLRTVGKMATLADWSREFRSMSDGLAAASVSKSLSMEPETEEIEP